MSFRGAGFAGRQPSKLVSSKPFSTSPNLGQRGTTPTTNYNSWIDDPRGDGWQFKVVKGCRIYRQVKGDKIDYTKKNGPPTDFTPTKGKYKPSSSWIHNTDWCEETKDYRNKDVVIKLKGVGSRLLRPGRGRLRFCIYPYRGMTAVRLYDKKTKTHLSTRLFNGEISFGEAKKIIFDGARTLHQVRKNGMNKPFKTIYRHIILSKDDFDKKFNPNTYESSSYKPHKKENKVLRSLSNIINESDGDEFCYGSPAAALNKCHKIFKSRRTDYNGEYPCVEVSAVWLNFDPETNILHEEYDAWEPIHYSYHLFHNREEMETHPL